MSTLDAVRVAWYRFRCTFTRRWASSVVLVLLIGLVGGLGLGGLAAARRTQSSFSVYLAATNPSDFTASIYTSNVGPMGSGYSAARSQAISRLAGVRHVAAAAVLNAFPLQRDGAPDLGEEQFAFQLAPVTGFFFTQDRVTVTRGRLAKAPDEIDMSATAAQTLGYHVGQVVPWGIYSQQLYGDPGFGSPAVPPTLRLSLRLVGLVAFNSSVVQDDIDRVPTFIVFSPALTHLLGSHLGEDSQASTYSIQVQPHHSVASVEQELARLVPLGSIESVHAQAPVVAKADASLRPIAIALGVFGGITLLAALLIAAQAISRRLREGLEEEAVLQALGANTATTLLDSAATIAAVVVFGVVVAAGVAVLLSPIAPLGPVRPVYPTLGFALDWTVVGFGALFLVIALLAITLALALRSAPHRVARRSRVSAPVASSFMSRASGLGLPAASVVGMRMALEPGRGRTAVPVRSALLATTLAVILVVTNLIFASSLQTLVTHPALYGWNWSYMLNPVGGNGGSVPPQVLAPLRRDHDVAAIVQINYQDANLDGLNVPFLFTETHAPFGPPTLSGQGVEGRDQIVLGAATMAQLHQHLGGTVTFSYGTRRDYPFYVPPTKLVIVGTATLPAVGFASVVSDHTSMGTGAIVANAMLPQTFLAAQENANPTFNGPNLVMVRLRPGVSAAAGAADAKRIARIGDRAFAAIPNGAGQGDYVQVVTVQRPAQIVNYKTMGATPALLGAALALGAVLALALTLGSSVRRRRRDLALLKTLGFTQRQLLAAVAWQSTTATLIGVLVGIPLGVVVGRSLWILFARLIYAVPQPTVPAGWIALVAVGALILANIVAALPGRMAARTPTAVLLRTE